MDLKCDSVLPALHGGGPCKNTPLFFVKAKGRVIMIRSRCVDHKIVCSKTQCWEPISLEEYIVYKILKQ